MTLLRRLRDLERARREQALWAGGGGGRTGLARPMRDGRRSVLSRHPVTVTAVADEPDTPPREMELYSFYRSQAPPSRPLSIACPREALPGDPVFVHVWVGTTIPNMWDQVGDPADLTLLGSWSWPIPQGQTLNDFHEYRVYYKILTEDDVWPDPDGPPHEIWNWNWVHDPSDMLYSKGQALAFPREHVNVGTPFVRWVETDQSDASSPALAKTLSLVPPPGSQWVFSTGIFRVGDAGGPSSAQWAGDHLTSSTLGGTGETTAQLSGGSDPVSLTVTTQWQTEPVYEAALLSVGIGDP